MSLGRRFHGVAAALQAGTPGPMIAVDDPMREMILQLGLPHVDMDAWNASNDKLTLLELTVAGFDVDEWRDRYFDAAARFLRTRMAALGSVSPDAHGGPRFRSARTRGALTPCAADGPFPGFLAIPDIAQDRRTRASVLRDQFEHGLRRRAQGVQRPVRGEFERLGLRES